MSLKFEGLALIRLSLSLLHKRLSSSLRNKGLSDENVSVVVGGVHLGCPLNIWHSLSSPFPALLQLPVSLQMGE